MSIKELRISKGLTQEEAAKIVGLSLRTYQNYEYGKSKRDKFKIHHIIKILNEYEKITLDKGMLTIDEIKNKVTNIVKNKKVSFVYLFGSYSQNTQTESSDVDLLISSEVKGLEFVGLIDELTQTLHKKVDLIRIDDLKTNFDFLSEILMKGIKIYESYKK